MSKTYELKPERVAKVLENRSVKDEVPLTLDALARRDEPTKRSQAKQIGPGQTLTIRAGLGLCQTCVGAWRTGGARHRGDCEPSPI